MLRNLLVATGMLLASCGVFGQDSSTSPNQLEQTLETSARLGQLEHEGATPFHLTASFEWFSPNGTSSGHGTLDELWRDAHHYRFDVELQSVDPQIPSGSRIEVDNGIQPWRTGRWVMPDAVARVESALLTPLLEVHPAVDKLSSQIEQNRSLQLNCIATEPVLPGVSGDAKVAQTTYCFTQGSPFLRIIDRPNDWKIGFNDLKSFEAEYIARSIVISHFGRLAIRAHVDSLTMPDDFSPLDARPPADAQLLKFHRADVRYRSGEVMHGQVIESSKPPAPHLSYTGYVVLKLQVDSAGRVSSAEVVSSTNKSLNALALAAVKQWRFRLSYQDGEVVEVEETEGIYFGQH
jgi:TonB family protein